MTAPAYPTVISCARCGHLESADEIRGDGSRGRRLGQTAGSTGNVACAGYEPGETRQLVPESELRRRLDAVLALHRESTLFPDRWIPARCIDVCSCGWQSRPREPGSTIERCPTVLAARGEP